MHQVTSECIRFEQGGELGQTSAVRQRRWQLADAMNNGKHPFRNRKIRRRTLPWCETLESVEFRNDYHAGVYGYARTMRRPQYI